jgi:hypothetical protein
MKSATLVYRKMTNHTLQLYALSAIGGDPVLHKFLHDVIHQRMAWKQQTKKCKPYTQDMFVGLTAELASPHSQDGLVSASSPALDWVNMLRENQSRVNPIRQSHTWQMLASGLVLR